MGHDAHHRPVYRLMHVREGRTVLGDAADKFMREMRMRAAVATPLCERQMPVFRGLINRPGWKWPDCFRQQLPVIRPPGLLDFFTAEMQHGFVAFGQLPFE